MIQFTDTALLEMDQVIHTSQSCIFSRDPDHFAVDIIALNIRLYFIIDQILRFLHRMIPVLARHQILPVLSKKTAVHTRCNISCHHCCLDRKSAASAKRINQNSIRFPRGQHDQC